MTKRLILAGEALVVVAAVAVVVLGRVAGWHGEVAYSVIAVTLAAGSGPGVLAARSSRRTPGVLAEGGPSGTVTTLIRVGAEPPEIARATVVLAAQAGPVVVLTGAGGAPEHLADLDVTVLSASTFEENLAAAVATITTDAVLITSARAVPLLDRCRPAAGLLVGDIGWVVGTAGTMNDDGFLDSRAHELDTCRRFDARAAGLDLWEPDATLVRTDVLAATTLGAGRPWGRILRRLCAAGLRGVHLDGETFALRCAPTAEGTFWPDTIGRQRAAAADAADAARDASLGWSRRLVAISMLSADLVALRAMLIGVAVLSLASSPYAGWRFGHVATSLVVCSVVAGRWIGTRLVTTTPVRPGADLLSALHRVPGSMSAIGPAFTRRVRPPRVPIPSRPLLWGALVLTALAGARLVDQSTDGAAPTGSIAASVGTLALLWVFGLRAFMRRNWERSTFRVPLQLPVTVDGSSGHAVDGSPLGMSVAMTAESATSVAAGAEVRIVVRLEDDTTFRTTGTVTSVRRSNDRTALGVSLRTEAEAADVWLAQLLRSATARDRSPAQRRRVLTGGTDRAREAGTTTRWTDRLAIALGGIASVATLAALVLVLSGFQPLVIRSGSMLPTLHVGDLVVGQPARASSLRPGDIVTVPGSLLAGTPAAGAESLTHRIRSVERDGDVLRITSRGDANRLDETWGVEPHRELRRAASWIPRVGAPAILLRTTGVALPLLVVAVGLMLAPIVRRGRARARPAGALPAPSLRTASERR